MRRLTEILKAPNLYSAKKIYGKKGSTEFDLNYFKNISHRNWYQICSSVFVCIY